MTKFLCFASSFGLCSRLWKSAKISCNSVCKCAHTLSLCDYTWRPSTIIVVTNTHYMT